MGMLEDCHPDHAWYQFISEPGHLGFAGTARERTWVIGSHMELTTCTSDPYEIYDDIRSWFTDYCQCKVSDYLVASEQEVRMEALEVANKLGLAHFVPGPSPMSILLNHRESDVARDLNEKYFQRTGYRPDSNPNLVYGLGDSAQYCSWSAASGKIPTYRLSTCNSKFWLPKYGRWMTCKERLLSMGFPVVGEVARSMRVPLIGAANVKRASDIIGNSMHLQTCGVFQLLALSCFNPVN